MVRTFAFCLLLLLHSGVSVAAQPVDSLQASLDDGVRPITLSDMTTIRRLDALSISHTGDLYAVLVRQGDPATNRYSASIFVGSISRGAPPVAIVEIGELQLARDSSGMLVIPAIQWAPNDQWIAFTRRVAGETQLWRVRPSGRQLQQVTRNAADVHDFAWASDSQALYYVTGAPRAELHEREMMLRRGGYRYDSDLYAFTELLLPQAPISGPEATRVIWVATRTGQERIASSSEVLHFNTVVEARNTAGEATYAAARTSSELSVRRQPDGSRVALLPLSPDSILFRVTGQNRDGADRSCTARVCTGRISRLWWSDDGQRAYFLRKDELGESNEAGAGGWGFYAWSPGDGSVSELLYQQDDHLVLCTPTPRDRVVCVRETPTQPQHLAVFDLVNRTVELLFDADPEFRSIRLGRVERFDWATPSFAWSEPGGALEGLYPARSYGYILYPPNFDPSRRYPVIIQPYSAYGFDNQVTSEHALHVYAANDFVVLNLSFPKFYDNVAVRLGSSLMERLYDATLDYPHLSMFAESTLRALDTVAARGFIDTSRVGIGGVSHGTFVPLFMLQRHERLTTVSISSASWGPHDYYWQTARGQSENSWMPRPDDSGMEFWQGISIADNVDAIEAPILMNLPATEVYAQLRLIRHLRDAHRPYDAYVFDRETHLKWQPAHLQAIQERNLDWFRFWLQDLEDPNPAKTDQYDRWHQLRQLQCQNPRSIRDFCAVQSTVVEGH